MYSYILEGNARNPESAREAQMHQGQLNFVPILSQNTYEH
jgi:hypothetical protein